MDANTVEFTTKKDGKVMGHETDMISSDGKTLTDKFTDLAGPNHNPFKYISPGRIGKRFENGFQFNGHWLTP